MASVRRTKLIVVAAVLSGAAFLTACQADDKDAASTTSSGAPTAAAAATATAAAPATHTPTAGSTGGSGTGANGTGTTAATARATVTGGTATTGKTGGSSGGGSNGNESRTTLQDINDGKGVNGTWFGNVKYLAPGKYTVSDMKGVEQQFFVAQDTEIRGAGDICGDTNAQTSTDCTEDELAAATKTTGVSAEVVLVNGIATTITEDH